MTTNRYAQAFEALKKSGGGAFIPFTVLGYPDPETCFQSIKSMIDQGATALELGIAFSDPVADGPVIQEAAFATLDRGFSVDDSFALVKRIRDYNATIPIGFLVYYNIVLARGLTSFFNLSAECGVDSILIADLPPDAADEIMPAAETSGVAPVFIVSPMTDDVRLKKIASLSKAYIYVVSRLGITGTDPRHDENLGALLKRTKTVTDLPLCVGFGVSSPEQAESVLALGADGAISGSRIIQLVKNDSSLKQLAEYIMSMVSAVKSRTAVLTDT